MSASLRAGATTSALQQEGTDAVTFDSNGIQTGHNIPTLGMIAGLTLSNNVSDAAKDIDIAIGSARDSTDTYTMNLSSIITKQIDATWAAGDDAGGLFSGSVAADTWYHVFIIQHDTTGAIDAGFDTSVTAANIPASYTAYRRIGSVLTDSTPDILAFTQFGDEFILATPINDYTGTWSTSGSLKTLSVPVDVNVIAKFSTTSADTSATAASYRISSPYENDVATTTANANIRSYHATSNGEALNGQFNVLTNTSSQIRERSTLATSLEIVARGWTDFRGKS